MGGRRAGGMRRLGCSFVWGFDCGDPCCCILPQPAAEQQCLLDCTRTKATIPRVWSFIPISSRKQENAQALCWPHGHARFGCGCYSYPYEQRRSTSALEVVGHLAVLQMIGLELNRHADCRVHFSVDDLGKSPPTPPASRGGGEIQKFLRFLRYARSVKSYFFLITDLRPKCPDARMNTYRQ